MRLIFDARHMQNPYTGLGRYTASLLRALLMSYSKKELDLVVLLTECDPLKVCAEIREVFLQEKSGRCSIRFVIGSPFSLRQHLLTASEINKLNGDMYFYPHFDPPIGVKTPFVFVVHDFLPLKVANYIQSHRFLKRLYFKWSIQYAISRAKYCFAVSENTRRDILNLVGATYCDRVFVAYEGSGLKPSLKVPKTSKFLVPDNFLLYVGDRRPHKNLVRVIDLFNSLRSCSAYSGELVIVGSKRNYGVDVDAYVGDNRKVHFTGNIPDDELAILYRSTDALVFLSEYEGFGLPVVEAAAYGKRMILSDGGSLGEIAPPWACVISQTLSLQEATIVAADYLAASFDIDPISYNSQFDWELTARKIFPEAYL